MATRWLSDLSVSVQAVDTNVLARALVLDSGTQAQCLAAQRWLSECKVVFVPQVVQLELAWLLGRVFALTRNEMVQILDALLLHPAVTLQAADAFEYALTGFKLGSDFGDGLILFEAQRVGAQVVTFDKKFATRAGATLLVVG